MQAPRDDNRVTSALGVTAGGVVTPWSIDHVTGYLNLLVTAGTLNAPVSVPSDAERDDNFRPVLMGVDAGGTRRAVMIDHTTGYVKCVISAS